MPRRPVHVRQSRRLLNSKQSHLPYTDMNFFSLFQTTSHVCQTDEVRRLCESSTNQNTVCSAHLCTLLIAHLCVSAHISIYYIYFSVCTLQSIHLPPVPAREGIGFYRKLQGSVSRLKKRAEEVCDARQRERHSIER